MRTVRIFDRRTCEIAERPDPMPSGDLVVVKNLVAPMCTEYKSYDAGHASENLGHEAAGEILEVAQPGRVRVGDRVVVMPQYPCGVCSLCVTGDYIHCQSGVDPLRTSGNRTGTATYATHVLKPDWLLLPVPDDIPLEHAAMACCGLGPTFGAMQRMRVTALDTVLITGLGPVGLGGVVNAVFRNARVIGVESHPYRAQLALELGAAAVVDPNDNPIHRIRELTDGRYPSVGIDCSGSAAAQRLLIDCVRRRGQVTFVGEAGDLTVHVSNDLIRKGLTLHGQWHYNLGEAPALFEVIRRSAARIDRMITHTFPLERVRDAFERQLTGNCGKVLLKPWEANA
ncbi:MAG: zinc-binding dehydrogenase [Capsulimonadales bacterium]|nr:zinc-binding dehydrogenase [Capsulimonadales bacterium]